MKRGSYKRSVWLEFDDTYFEPRCGRCGRWKKKEELREHWFFKGVYCLTCIIDVLYDNCRNLEEIR